MPSKTRTATHSDKASAKKASAKSVRPKPELKPQPEPQPQREAATRAQAEPAAQAKPAVKYGYSINFAAPAPEAAVVSNKKPHAADKTDEPAAKAKSDDKSEFAKEEEAVKEAETIDESKVEHIKYADKDADKVKDGGPKPGLEGSKPGHAGAAEAGGCSGGACSPGGDESAPSSETWLQQLRAMPAKEIAHKAWSTTRGVFTVKNAEACMAKALAGVDAFISFITVSHAEDRNEVMQRARLPILFGMWVCIFTFVIGGFWAGFAPLDSASHATGVVVTLSKKQVIQGPREGGILEEILVKEGDHVKTGQVLAKVDDASIKAQVDALRVQKENLEKQVQTWKESLAAHRKLEAQGFISKFELLKIEGGEGDIQSRLSGVNSELLRFEESLDKFTVKSPINGVVSQIDVHTIGTMLAPSQSLMTLTPSDEDLIIEGYVSQRDIESVHVGLKAQVKIQAFKHRSVGSMEGIVTYVSHDIVDMPAGQAPTARHGIESSLVTSALQHLGGGYKIKVSVDKAQLKTISKYKDYDLAPGMMADITIVTGERTMLQYLLDPLTSTFAHAFIEK